MLKRKMLKKVSNLLDIDFVTRMAVRFGKFLPIHRRETNILLNKTEIAKKSLYYNLIHIKEC
ncbi:MAG: hypothetical protein A7315_02570 [Candidatus Altiarchaeales archaeon WOR_SM1_79]|nr:MAG: hypothetical protein A7315_02570 [Candidatus Altiarchaeales archaeon WOR_SM1_79]